MSKLIGMATATMLMCATSAWAQTGPLPKPNCSPGPNQADCLNRYLLTVLLPELEKRTKLLDDKMVRHGEDVVLRAKSDDKKCISIVAADPNGAMRNIGTAGNCNAPPVDPNATWMIDVRR